MSEEELKPCPYCNNTAIELWEDDDGETICCCESCGLCGPWGKNAVDAKQKWNSLPRKLQLTKEKPKENGFYWAREKKYDNTFTIAFVNSSTRATVFIGCEDYYCADDIDCEWAGPIPEPEKQC